MRHKTFKLHIYIYIYIYKYACVYVCKYVCVYVCMMYVCMYDVCTYERIYVSMYECMCLCMFAGTHLPVYVCTKTRMCLWMYAYCIYIYICVCVCVFKCTHLYIAYAVDKNKPHFSVVPEGRPQRDRWKSLQADEKGKRKQTIFRTRIYRLETFKNLLRSISSGPFQCPLSGLRTEENRNCASNLKDSCLVNPSQIRDSFMQ